MEPYPALNTSREFGDWYDFILQFLYLNVTSGESGCF